MQNYLFVALGAALGGASRFWVSTRVQTLIPPATGLSVFPLGTLAVNVIGSFLLGFLVFYMDARQMLSPQMKMLTTVGFCGGFTTFSTFSYETFNLLKDSQILLAAANMGLNFLLSLSAVVLAWFATRTIGG